MAIKVELGKDESIDSALKRLAKVREREGIVKELKKREFFVKPSALRHEHDRGILHRHKRKMKKSRRKEY